MLKRAFAVLLSAIIILSCLSLSAFAITKEDAIAWARQQTSRSLADCDCDGNGPWCVDLATAYMNYIWNTDNNKTTDPWGINTNSDNPYTTSNANQYDNRFSNHPCWTVVERSSSPTPQPGDLFISEQDDGYNGYGHIGIVITPYGSNSAEIIDMSHTVAPNIHTVTWGQSPSYAAQHFMRYNYYASSTYHGSEMTSGAGKTLLDGDYEIICEADTTYQLDVVGTTIPAANGANVRIYQRLATPRQKDIFTVTYLNNGFYKIVQKDTDMSLDVDGASTAEGANIKVMPYVGNTAQQYSISRTSIDGVNKTYNIQAKCSGLALDVSGEFKNMANVQQWRQNNTNAQGWLFIPCQPEQPLDDGRYILLSALDTSYELDVAGNSSSISSGTNVRVWKDTGCQSIYNSFDITKLSNGYYKIINAASGLALGVPGGGSVFSQNVAVITASNDDAQRWAITKYRNGYILRVRSSGYALDAESNTTLSNGTNVSQHPVHGNNNQIWKFVKAEHTVEYKANGGSGAPAAQTKYYKSDLTLSSTKPTRTGYTFLGWNTSSNATTAAYQPGGKYTTDADLGLYAIWKANNYTVTFNANGGNVSTTSKTVTYDAAYGTLPTPNWTGHRFDGWFTAVSGGSKVTSSTTVKTAKNHTLYAHWTDINPFVDVAEGKYYYDAVLWAYYHDPQITGGTDKTHFSPGQTCTREQIVTFLWKACGAPEPTMTINPFSDVMENKYYYKAVLWAVQNGITGGVGDGKFGVGQPCTREQAMTFLWKASGSPEPKSNNNPFSDVKSGKYYYKAILWAVENKITSGVSENQFGVGQSCTRGQIVTFLYKAMGD